MKCIVFNFLINGKTLTESETVVVVDSKKFF